MKNGFAFLLLYMLTLLTAIVSVTVLIAEHFGSIVSLFSSVKENVMRTINRT